MKLNYYDMDTFIELSSIGKLQINSMIQLSDDNNHVKDISYLDHLLYLCNTNNKDLLFIIYILSEKIESFIIELMNHNSIHKFIMNTIHQWNINIDTSEIFKHKMDYQCKYEDFTNIDIEYNQIKDTFQNLENIINSKQYLLDSEIKDNILLLNTNCDIFYNRTQEYLNKISKLLTNYEPLYIDIILDLSSKNKQDYINYYKYKIKNNDHNDFNKLLITTSKHIIPDNINYIFLNYIYLHNLLKKELLFITNRLTNECKHICKMKQQIDIIITNFNIN